MSHFIAIDIGTTTLAFALVCRKSKKILHTCTSTNHQRKYGLDVITRIYNAEKGNAEQLQKIICEDLEDGIRTLLNNHEYVIDSVIISANTTMVHLLMQYPCAGLGVYPYTPFTPAFEVSHAIGADFWQDERLLTVSVSILPHITAFAGGDIISGLLATSFFKSEKPTLFLDLGTNGEMVLYNSGTYYVTSTAAGPALEGGRIHHGRPGIPGAISHVKLFNGTALTETIDHAPVLGICGTGIIDITAELYRNHFIAEDGLLLPPFRENGFPVASTVGGNPITFSQNDIREIQMAKSAIRSGIEILLETAGITTTDLDTLILAGGLGYHINPVHAQLIGLLPDLPINIIKTPGNTSLQGAIHYGLYPEDLCNVITAIKGHCIEVSLASHPHFQDYYLKYMNF